jgi:hypothetical protein
MKLGENTEVIKSHIPIQLEEPAQSMDEMKARRETTMPYESEGGQEENVPLPHTSGTLQQVDENFNELQREYERREMEIEERAGQTFSSKETMQVGGKV